MGVGLLTAACYKQRQTDTFSTRSRSQRAFRLLFITTFALCYSPITLFCCFSSIQTACCTRSFYFIFSGSLVSSQPPHVPPPYSSFKRPSRANKMRFSGFSVSIFLALAGRVYVPCWRIAPVESSNQADHGNRLGDTHASCTCHNGDSYNWRMTTAACTVYNDAGYQVSKAASAQVLESCLANAG